jgi:predicted nucleic acid-binding Zn ribbon protein
MENESATPLALLLQKMAAKSGLDKKLLEVSVMEYWKDAVGERAAKSCVVQRIEHGRLLVHCASPVWRTELQMRKAEIITRLNERVGSVVVQDIVLK